MLVSTGRTAEIKLSGGRTAKTTKFTEFLSEAVDAAQQKYPTAQLVLPGDFNAFHQDY